MSTCRYVNLTKKLFRPKQNVLRSFHYETKRLWMEQVERLELENAHVRLFHTRFHHVKPCSTNSCCIRFSKPHPHVTAQSPRDIWHQCDLLAAGTPIALMIHRLALQARSLSECPRPTLNSEGSWNAEISELLDPGTSQWKSITRFRFLWFPWMKTESESHLSCPHLEGWKVRDLVIVCG